MSFIHLTTFIAAPVERVFDLSRSVTLHRKSMEAYGEKSVGGIAGGLMNLNDEVTWSARHLFKERTLKVKITRFERPDFFADEMISGDFAMMKHEHYFKSIENGTIMIDQFHYEVKGFLQKMVNRIYLEKYMTRLLNERNQTIRLVAEGNQWKQYLEING